MAKPLTRAQALQNQHFLRALRRTGNIRLAACAVGVKYSTIQHRRRAHPTFAQRWDVALDFAQARLTDKGRQGPRATEGGNRTAGGEPVITRRNDGKLQIRAAARRTVSAILRRHFSGLPKDALEGFTGVGRREARRAQARAARRKKQILFTFTAAARSHSSTLVISLATLMPA